MALSGRMSDAESVLADYYKARKKQKFPEDIGLLNEGLYHRCD